MAVDAHSPAAYTSAEILVTRERLGLTRPALGRMLGVSERAVQRWEDGERSMTPANAESLTRLVELADREVARLVWAVEHGEQGVPLVVYRSDRHLREHDPDSAVTAGWVRAIAGRVADATGVGIEYAP